MENIIRLWIIKCKMKKDFLNLNLKIRMDKMRKVLGEKFKYDPYGEENWNE